MNTLSNTLKRSLLAAALAALCAVGAGAQTKDAHVISARAGGVNHVSGDVKFRPGGAAEWQTLKASDTLEAGDTVQTGASGQVEVLLNPGSYFRLGENSEFTLSDDSLDNLRLKLARGSAVVEAIGFDQLNVSISVETPHTRALVVRSGLYRFNVLDSGATEVAVFKGRALVGREALKVKGRQVARVGAAGVELAKLDKKQRDALDDWSKERGKTLAKLNQKLSRREVNTLLATTDWTTDASFGLSSGLWFFSRGSNCWVFLPSGFGRWSSPYGSSYGNSIFFGRNPFGNCGGCNGSTYVQVGPNYGVGGTYGGNTHTVGGGNGSGGGHYGGGNGNGSGNTGGGQVAPPPPPPPMREPSRPSVESLKDRVTIAPHREQ